MKLLCNKFPDTFHPATFDDEGTELAQAHYVPACRFYLLATDKQGRNTGERWKVHVDGEVDFKAVAKRFKDEHGKDVKEADVRAAYPG